jgi:hypothetical protein
MIDRLKPDCLTVAQGEQLEDLVSEWPVGWAERGTILARDG